MVNILKKIKASEFGMRLQEKFYPSEKSDPAHTALFLRAMSRYKKCPDKKDASQIKREIKICKQYWKCYPHHYFMYDLYKKNKQLTDDELKNYIPQFYWSKLFLSHYKSVQFSPISDNKILTDLFFKALEIKQPKTVCALLNHNLYSSTMKLLSNHQVLHEIAYEDDKKIFVKPAGGEGGKGIYIFHKNNEGLLFTRENIKFDEDFFETIKNNRGYIIQEGVTQDPEISKIYPDSVNTCRIITENKNGVVRVVCAILRIGRGHEEIDNISAGGICVNIDINSGKFGNFAISYDAEEYAQHPDSHFVFKDEKMSRWSEIRNFAIVSAGKLPFFTYVGWDIALTPEGPVAIEINISPSINGLQTSHGLREAFGIDDPDYYWKNPGNRI
jgi:hypothetical protein